MKVGDTTTDHSGDKNWFTRELTYDLDGELTNKTLTYDDGDILKQQYATGISPRASRPTSPTSTTGTA
ncbi:MAG: hypothetical protein AcusKO_39850 [Acuticoccus sp.]